MLWILISVGIVQLLLGVAVILFHRDIKKFKKLHHDFENHGHYNSLGE